MEAPWLTHIKESKDCSISWKGYGLGFWDADGILMVDYLQKVADNQYYVSLLRQCWVDKNIKVKFRVKLSKGVLFHQNNAPAHISVIAMAAISDCGFELIQHPPYSHDLAPSDFHLFPNWKRPFLVHFQSDDDVIHAVEDLLNSQENDFFNPCHAE